VIPEARRRPGGGSSAGRRAFLKWAGLAPAGLAAAGVAGCGVDVDPPPVDADPDLVAAVPLPVFPDPLEGGYVDLPDVRIFYQTVGDGVPLVLLHGYPLSGALFARNRDLLAEQYQVITLDHRGYGQSVTPAVPADLSVHARETLAVLDALDVGPAVIAGHGMSGPVVLDMYTRAPDRFRGMILIDTTAGPPNLVETSLWNGIAHAAGRPSAPDVVADFLLTNLLSGHTRATEPPLAEYLAAVVRAASPEALISGARAMATRPDRRALLDAVTIPALVVVGEEDTRYPVTTARHMVEALPRAELLAIPDAATAAVLEAPAIASTGIARWADGI
jgi:pimeloyl-ACP methyl ester carboxylesterase